ALEALAKLLGHQLRVGVTDRAIQTATRLLALDPLQETVHRTLMRLYVQQARRGAALKQYQICVSILQREFGVEPETETKQLYRQILQRRSIDIAETSDRPASARAESSASQRNGPDVHPGMGELVDVAPVGRDAELRRLREALDRAMRGHGGVVMVTSEAGIGKSRLLRTLAGDSERRGAHVLRGSAYESEQILPFGPWIDAFRKTPAVFDEAVLGALGPMWRAELSRLLPEAGGLGLPTPSTDARRLFESVGRFVNGLAVIRPVTLFLEDLHWADAMSIRLLSFLAPRVAP